MSESIVGEWAKDKLDRLYKYLSAYTKILNKQEWCRGFHYVDAFAGPGEHSIRQLHDEPSDGIGIFYDAGFQQSLLENQEVIAGSPLVALGVVPAFTTYTFIELNPRRISRLNQLAANCQSTVRIVSANCADFLKNEFVPSHNWKKERAVVFLDPFGMQVNWDTVQALADTKAIEIFLNFPVGMAIQRLLLRRPEEFSQSTLTKLNAYFGTDEWFNVVYKKRRGLFGDEEDKISGSGDELLKWYMKRLKGAFGYVSKASLIRNSRGGHLYYLILAGPKETGAKIASCILGAGSKIKN